MTIEALRERDGGKNVCRAEAMALRIRMRVLYNLLKYELPKYGVRREVRKMPKNLLIATLLGVHVQTIVKWRGAHTAIGRHAWPTLKLAEIALSPKSRADRKKMMIQYIENRLPAAVYDTGQGSERPDGYGPTYARAFAALEVEVDLGSIEETVTQPGDMT